MDDLYPAWDSTRVVRPRPPRAVLHVGGEPSVGDILRRILHDFERPPILGPVPCAGCLRPVVLTAIDGLWLNAESRTVHAPPCACSACDCSYAVCDPEGVGFPLCHPCDEGEHLVG